jgi:hypothetical protein
MMIMYGGWKRSRKTQSTPNIKVLQQHSCGRSYENQQNLKPGELVLELKFKLGEYLRRVGAAAAMNPLRPAC